LNNISGKAEALKQNNGTLTVTHSHMRRSTSVIWRSRAFYLIRGNQSSNATSTSTSSSTTSTTLL